MTPPIDILDIASSRLYRIRQRLMNLGLAQTCELTTQAYEQTLYEISLAELDLSRAKYLGRWLDGHQ